jgi:hypothetical protein
MEYLNYVKFRTSTLLAEIKIELEPRYSFLNLNLLRSQKLT